MSAAPDWSDVSRIAGRVLQKLDWRVLGDVYFHWGGESFWAERRPRVLELGGELGRRLLREVPRGGASLWVGAGVAELPVLLGEVLLHGRTVVATNLRAEECRVLDAGLRAAAPEVPLQFLPEDARAAVPGRTFDHLGCISVFTDPESWPVLSDVAYGRIAPVQVDVDRFVAERQAAREVAAALFARLQRPGVVTTSAEEAAWFLEQADLAGCGVEATDDLVDTAVVGDPVGFLRVGAAATESASG